MKFVSALCIVFLSGCAATSEVETYHYPIHSYLNKTLLTKNLCIDSRFDPEDRKDISLALEDWNTALNGAAYFSAHRSAPCDWSIFSATNEDVIASSIAATDSRILAYTDFIGGNTVYVFRNRIHSQGKLKRVALHEIGHLLQAEHFPDHHGLMSEFYSWRDYECVDERTINLVCKLNELDCRVINPCQKDPSNE